MIDPAVRDELLRHLDGLPADLQRRVLGFARALTASSPRGVAGSDLMRFAGVMDARDATEMRDAIEEGCERVDAERW